MGLNEYMDLEKMQFMQLTTEEANFLKILAHPVRLMVLNQLVDGEVRTADLLEKSDLSQSAFSQHLRILRDKGLVETRKDAQQVFYSISDNRVRRILKAMQETFSCQVSPQASEHTERMRTEE